MRAGPSLLELGGGGATGDLASALVTLVIELGPKLNPEQRKALAEVSFMYIAAHPYVLYDLLCYDVFFIQLTFQHALIFHITYFANSPRGTWHPRW